MRDLLMGPMLGEGAYGVVYLARHRALEDRWYAVKRLSMAKLRATPKGRQQLRYLEREREVLMLLARETRGTRYRDLFVRMVTSHEDPDSLQLVMPAVLGAQCGDSNAASRRTRRMLSARSVCQAESSSTCWRSTAR